MLLGGGAFLLAACSSDDDAASPAPTTTPEPPPAEPEPTTEPEEESVTQPESEEPTAEPEATESEALSDPGLFDALPICVLIPEAAAGPFPLDEQFNRRDITEGYPGEPLRVGLRVVDTGCQPIPGAAVEIWHTDATGDYSAYEDNGSGKDEGPGTTFMRGTQTAADDGIVWFDTIYPGWYEGRTIHIHVRVWRDGEITRTSQLYFDQGLTERIMQTGAYAEFGQPDTTNETDGLAGDIETDGSLLREPGPRFPTETLTVLANLGV